MSFNETCIVTFSLQGYHWYWLTAVKRYVFLAVQNFTGQGLFANDAGQLFQCKFASEILLQQGVSWVCNKESLNTAFVIAHFLKGRVL